MSSNLTVSRVLVSITSGKIAVATTLSSKLPFLHNVSSDIQTQLNSKHATITGGATSILTSDLIISSVLVSYVSGKVATSSTASSNLAFLDNITSDIQTNKC